METFAQIAVLDPLVIISFEFQLNRKTIQDIQVFSTDRSEHFYFHTQHTAHRKHIIKY